MENILFSILMVAAIIGFVLHNRFLQMLRANHIETWLRLGSPTLFLNNSIKNGLEVQQFLWKREYLDLNDPDVTKLCSFLRIYSIAYIIFFISFVVLFLTKII